MNYPHKNAIEINNLVKRYGPSLVLDNIDLTVPTGCIFGLLGPNGAGKTTLIEILEGIRRPDSGSVAVCNVDPVKFSREIKHLVGVQLQETHLNEMNTVSEVFELFASLYFNESNPIEIIKTVKLYGSENKLYRDLSGGKRQLVAIGLALLGQPDLIFLDEPTVGLDVHARIEIYEVIKNIRLSGKTVFLTTHYLEEAEDLCDLIAILDGGKLIACGTPRELIDDDLQDKSIINFELQSPISEASIHELFDVTNFGLQGNSCTVRVQDVQKFFQEIIKYSVEQNNPIVSIGTRKNKLQDVFIKLTKGPNNA
jgi:ABC-2 type transport system ATP-binding protein